MYKRKQELEMKKMWDDFQIFEHYPNLVELMNQGMAKPAYIGALIFSALLIVLMPLFLVLKNRKIRNIVSRNTQVAYLLEPIIIAFIISTFFFIFIVCCSLLFHMGPDMMNVQSFVILIVLCYLVVYTNKPSNLMLFKEIEK